MLINGTPLVTDSDRFSPGQLVFRDGELGAHVENVLEQRRYVIFNCDDGLNIWTMGGPFVVYAPAFIVT